MNKLNLLCITPVKSIDGLMKRLEDSFSVTYLPDPDATDFLKYCDVDVVFTNPNKTKIFLGEKNLKFFSKLKIIATASTGTVHIDKNYCNKRDIKLISLTKEIPVLEKITSTAEHAFLLTLAGSRNIISACKSVDRGEWDYERFVGRQINKLTIGVLGFGRLGKMYAKYADAFGAEVLICDPYVGDTVSDIPYKMVTTEQLFTICDVVSLHIHATEENFNLVNQNLLKFAKKTLLLINTSRGEVVNELQLLSFLSENPQAKYYTDVLLDESCGLSANQLYTSPFYGEQIVITPHVGGMSSDAQKIAYNHCLDMLLKYLNISNTNHN